MKVEVKQLAAMTFVGTVGITEQVQSQDICRLWDEFTANRNITNRLGEADYELHIFDPSDPPRHICLTGTAVSKVEDLPLNLFAKTIPAGKYAVFTLRMADGGFPHAYQFMEKWLADQDYESPDAAHHRFEVQVYDQRFEGLDNPESEIDFLIPLFKLT